MRPEISEFSYGFALISELIRSPGFTIIAAPIFPSLYQEGQTGGGWDVRIDRPGLPLFIQFKLCDFMSRRNCREARNASFSIPCYRMHLRSARISSQHEMLLDLENSGQEVYYLAPMFHRSTELNTAFLAGDVRNRSLWIRPSDIGPLPDNRDHHVSFEPGSPWTFFSDPRRLEAKRDFNDVTKGLSHNLRVHGQTALSHERLEALAKALAEISKKRSDIPENEQWQVKTKLQQVDPLQRVSYYASIFLECQLFVVQDR